MKIETMIRNAEELNNATLRKAEDFNEHLGELIHMAEQRESGKEIKPCSGNKDFATCVNAIGNKLSLWYNDKTGNTKKVEKQV